MLVPSVTSPGAVTFTGFMSTRPGPSSGMRGVVLHASLGKIQAVSFCEEVVLIPFTSAVRKFFALSGVRIKVPSHHVGQTRSRLRRQVACRCYQQQKYYDQYIFFYFKKLICDKYEPSLGVGVACWARI